MTTASRTDGWGWEVGTGLGMGWGERLSRTSRADGGPGGVGVCVWVGGVSVDLHVTDMSNLTKTMRGGDESGKCKVVCVCGGGEAEAKILFVKSHKGADDCTATARSNTSSFLIFGLVTES